MRDGLLTIFQPSEGGETPPLSTIRLDWCRERTSFMVISFLKIFLHVFTLALPGSIPDPSFKTQVVVPGRHINEPSWRFDSVSLQRDEADCPNCYIARVSG